MRSSARMRRLIAVLLIALPVFAADPAEEVRQAEIGFAKAFADRDQAKFFSFVLDDATFLGPLRTLSGKAAITERWTRYLSNPEAPFSWTPERTAVNASGMVGLSTGPVYDAKGNRIGEYTSTWLKQPDGRWKVLFDGPGSPALCLASDAAPFEQGFVTADDGTKLHYRKIGDGPITVIVPFGAVLFDFFKQYGDIATVITYDMRNRGRSEEAKDPATWTLQWDVKDLEAVRRQFNIDKFVPVGFSYLGRMVVMYAMDHPEHVSRIVQLGPVAMDPNKEYPSVPAANVAAAKDETCAEQARVQSYQLVGDPKHASRITSLCDLENEWPANFRKHLAVNWESSKKVTLTPMDVQKVTMPVLTIHGTSDRNAPYGGGRDWAMTLPNARLVTVPGAAHASWADAPEVVFAATREFLRGGWPPAAENVKR